eukprot:gb/GECG01007286.1/.p1 GENE.gb/GECG01007286.1/~~gb/GECG01007286.1/.p1  ORF type:complete len:162 (+),score=30.88 gb/GECG01007286.1/:1-486(+)
MHNALVGYYISSGLFVCMSVKYLYCEFSFFFFSDELIRQVTINCAERGLLLLRVRDEIRMTIAAYQTLYESSIAFGMRKALMAEQRRAHLKEKLEQLRSEKSDLQQQVESLRQKLDQMQQDEERKAKQEEDEHQTEVQRLTDINNQLKGQLEDLLAAPTKK